VSIHQELLSYIKSVKSEIRTNQNKKIITEKKFENHSSINLMGIYKFNIENHNIEIIKKYIEKKCRSAKILRILADGGCAERRRLGTFGCTFYLDDDNFFKLFGNIGNENTNNTAEYSGIIMSLLLLNIFDFPNTDILIQIYSDSELLCNQINGKYKVKTAHIVILNAIAKNLYTKIKNRKEIRHVLREFNQEADYLANQGKYLNNNSFELYYN